MKTTITTTIRSDAVDAMCICAKEGTRRTRCEYWSLQGIRLGVKVVRFNEHKCVCRDVDCIITQPKTLQLHPLNTSRDLDPTIARVLNDHDNHYSTLLAETKVRRNPFSSMTPALAIVQKEHTLLRSSVDSPSDLPTDSFGPESFSRSCINKILLKAIETEKYILQ